LQKKYQVFVSSTFSDLVEERQDTIRSVLDLGHIPAGMEIFPATDSEQFEYIKKVIDECDYYVLIVGARYGSVDTSGISFTEKEYDYASEKNIPILVFPHGDTSSISIGKSDTDPSVVERLNSFRSRATKGRLVQFWKTRSELKTKVLVSLSKAFQDQPGDGWIRATRTGSEIVSLGALPATQNKPSVDHDEGDVAKTKIKMTSPEPGWTRRQYQMATLDALLDKDTAAFDRINEAYLHSIHCRTDNDRLTWEANVEYFKLLVGQTGHLDNLVTLAELHPTCSGVVEYLALAYAHFNESGRAAETYLAASESAPNAEAVATLRQQAARQFALDGNFKSASMLVESMRQTTTASSSEQLSLLRVLLTIAELRKDEAASIVIMERLVELKPDENEVRFKLAFKHSEIGNQGLALQHYLRTDQTDREAGTWNNLGVAFEHFGLDVSAVNAYREAAKMGSPVAMANLGNKLLSAGFLEDAQSECDNALKQDTSSKNAGDLIARISDAPDQEDARRLEVLSEAKPKMDFYRTMGKAIASPTPQLHPSWVGPDCTLNLKHDKENIELVGSFFRDQNGLLAALMGSQYSGAVVKIEYTVRYSGAMQGRAFFGTLRRNEPGASLLATTGSERNVCMALNEEGSEFSVMEGADTSHPTFYAISRVAE
jgi:tetratricopeptide (TPR) repeat protein